MLLNVTNTGTGFASGIYPIINGSYTSFTIKNTATTVTGGEALLITPQHGRVMYGFTSNVTSTTLNGINALNITLTNNGNCGLTAMQQFVRIGDIISIPYGNNDRDRFVL